MLKTDCFELSLDKAANLLSFRLIGLWEMATAQEFDRHLRPQFSGRRNAGQPFDVLADLRDWPVQTQETMEIHQALMAYGKECGMRRVAILTHSALLKMQIMHRAKDEAFHAFADEASAQSWLAMEKV
jgi:hypothetical protein